MFSDTMMLGGGRKAAYSIENSLLFRGGEYLSRTFVTPTDQYVWTFSTWVRRAALSASTYFDLFASSTVREARQVNICLFKDTIAIEYGVSGISGSYLTGPLLRDTGSWYHIVVSADLRSSTDSERIKIYVNGQKVVLTGSQPAQLSDWGVNSAVVHTLGSQQNPETWYHLSGSMAEIAFIDGQALPPTKFGELDPLTGSWRPKRVQNVNFGSNGFYLGKPWNPDTGFDGWLGHDYSGRGNNWIAAHFLASDVLNDSPTNVYATLNMLIPASHAGSVSYSEGNSKITTSSTTFAGTLGTIQIPVSGKWYFEAENLAAVSGSPCLSIGLADAGVDLKNNHSTMSGVWCFNFQSTRYLNLNGTSTTYAAGGLPTNTTGMVAVDVDNGKVWFGFNGSWYSAVNTIGGDPAAGVGPTVALNASGKYPFLGNYGPITNRINFGQRPFAYTPPSGFKALCTSNLPTPVSAAAKQPWTYYSCQLVTHDGSNTAVALGWDASATDWLARVKVQGTGSWYYIDTKRGLNKYLRCDQEYGAGAEGEAVNRITGRSPSGFSLGNGFAAGTYLVEVWRVAPEAGFDIGLYNGTGAIRTISHNNDTAAAYLEIKGRTGVVGAAQNWRVYHQSVGATSALLLSSPAAASTSKTYWNDTAPVSSQITLGTDTGVNASDGTYVAYVWSEVPGFSAFGKWEGNGDIDGPYAHLGFSPGSLVTKMINSSTDWENYNVAQNKGNPTLSVMALNKNAASSASPGKIDFGARGMKVRSNSTDSQINTLGGTVVYAAFAMTASGSKGITPAPAR